MVEVDDLFVSRAMEEGELESHQSCKRVALLGTRQIVLLYTRKQLIDTSAPVATCK